MTKELHPNLKDLPIGPRLARLANLGLADDLLWEERYPYQETRDHFVKIRQDIETMSESELLDLWCRGQSLIGFSAAIILAVDGIRKARKASQ